MAISLHCPLSSIKEEDFKDFLRKCKLSGGFIRMQHASFSHFGPLVLPHSKGCPLI